MIKTIAKDVTIAGIVGFVLTRLLRRRQEREQAPKRFFHRLLPH